MIPQPVISKRDKGNHSVQNTLSAAERDENKRTEAGKRLSAAVQEKMKTRMKTSVPETQMPLILRQEFRLLQAELRIQFRTEIAGYDALRLHTEEPDAVLLMLILFVYLARPGR